MKRRDGLKLLGAAGVYAVTRGLPRASDRSPVPSFRRGINIHNLLNWPNVQKSGDHVTYDRPAFRGADYTIQAAELAGLRMAGFDFIRLTVDPSIFMASSSGEITDLDTHCTAVLNQLLDAGFNIVFDLHPVAVNPKYNPTALVSTYPNSAFSDYLEMVSHISAFVARFKPDRVALELFNEPWIESLRDAGRWQSMAEALHAQARQKAPQLTLVLGGAQWNSAQALMMLDLHPFRSSNVIYTFHYYDPHTYTHEGVAGQDAAWINGLAWPIKVSELGAIEQRALARVSADKTLSAVDKANAQRATSNDIAKLRRDPPDDSSIARDFNAVADWAKKNSLDPRRVLLGEFGCVGESLGASLGEGRLRWLSAVRSNCEKAGFSWAYWAYKGFGGMSLIDQNSRLDNSTLTALGLNGGR